VPTGRDDSIQTFGLEADAGDRIAAAGALSAFLDARAAGRWSEACSYGSVSLLAQLRQPAAEGGRSPGCPVLIKTFTEGVSRAALLVARDMRVLSLRVQGRQGFLIYRDAKGMTAVIPMQREEGWKVGALEGSALIY
jgi:hypothetical protein